MNLRRPPDLNACEFPVNHRLASDFAVVEPFLVMCQRGDLYAAESWIARGNPIEFTKPADRKLQRRGTPLIISVENGFFSLAALLLVNGYNPSPDGEECLTAAVEAKDLTMVNLLLSFGVGPDSVDFASVLLTYDRTLMDRFIAAGVDPCRDNATARGLAHKARPALGFVKQYRDAFPCLQRQVDIALHMFVKDNDAKGVALALWLGADAYVETPESLYERECDREFTTTAFESALWGRREEILTQILRRPFRKDRLDEILSKVARHKLPYVVRRLVAEGANPNAVYEDGRPALKEFINALLWKYSPISSEDRERGFEALELALKAGARWVLDEDQIKSLRRDLVEGESKTVVRLIELIRQYEAISADQLHELTRTPAVIKVLKGYTKPSRYFSPPVPPPSPWASPPMAENRKPKIWTHWSRR